MSIVGIWWRLTWLAVALLVVCGSASAAPEVRPAYRVGVHTFTGDDGLPQSGVNAVVQTHDGYLWIGTFGGLARFDGLTFTVFRGKPSLDTPDTDGQPQAGPASDRILSLFEDDEKRLWIGTQDAGLSVYSQGTFHQLPVCGGTCQINGIFQAPDRKLWIASNAGLFILDPVRLRETRIDPANAGHEHLALDGRGRMYVGGGSGFFAIVGRELRRIPLPVGDQWIEVLETSGRDLIVGTNRALYRYEPDQGQWQPLGVANPTAAVKDLDGRWWVATTSGRLVRENGAGEWRDIPELFGLGITSLARDDEGNVWIGSGSKGLLRVRKPLFGLLPMSKAGMNMAGRAVTADGRDSLWFGTGCGGLRHWRHDGTLALQPLRPAADDDCITSLALDHENALLVGTSDGRLVRVAEGKPKLVGTWLNVGEVDIWRYDDGRFLVNARSSTFELEIDEKGRVARQRRIDALQGMDINNVIPAARGGHWLASDQGVLRLVDDRIVDRWTPRQGLSSRFARALYEDKESATLWVGTYGGGLNRIHDGQVRRYDSRNGLFDDTVSCILPDDQGRLWLGGNRGISLLPAPREATTKIESVGYAAGDGLIPAEINGGHSTSCHRDTQGRLWFSLVEGFAVADPGDFPEVAPVSLRPRIEAVAVAGSMQKIAGSSLVLEPSSRSLEIHYTAINLSRPRETYFRFRLLGFDADWVEAGQNRSILYPSVPWGKHLFEVQARTQGGQWSPVSASLTIINPQPWYLRTWIVILATSLCLLALVGGTHFGASQMGSGRGETSG